MLSKAGPNAELNKIEEREHESEYDKSKCTGAIEGNRFEGRLKNNSKNGTP